MKYVIDLPGPTIERINQLVQKDSVEDIHQFIQIAIQNQLILENIEVGELRNNDTIVLSKESEPLGFERSNTIRTYQTDQYNVSDIHPMPAINLHNNPIPGWYNRIFPLKMALRIILMELSNKGSLKFDDYKSIITQEMIQIKPFMLDIDDGFNLSRGRRVSIGFPDDNEKSRKRFESHYLGIIRTNGDVIGAMPNLGFINIPLDNDLSIGITEHGMDFALIPNPIIDNKMLSPDVFSPEEVRFLIDHIKINIPEEFSLIMKLLSWVDNGINEPNDITLNIQKVYPDWSNKVSNNIRIGLIGRLIELGLIQQNRNGIHISYSVVDDYQDLIEGPYK